MGTFLHFLEPFETPGVTASLPSRPRVQGDRIGTNTTNWIAESSVSYHMQQSNQAAFDGRRHYSFFEDFYLRIYLIPDFLNFGTFGTDTTINMVVWNAYLEDATLLTADFEFGEEVAMNTQAPPITWRALQYRVLPFTASEEGPPILTDSLELTFDQGDFFIVPITGFRVPQLDDLLFPIRHDWSAPLRITYEFLTDIVTSERGNEQRRQMRDEPRVSIEQRAIIRDNYMRREWNRLMATSHNARWYVPDRSRFVRTTEALIVNDVEVTVENTPWWLETDYFVILDDGIRFELYKVDFTGEDTDGNRFVHFRSNVEYEWREGTKIFAAHSAWLRDEIGSSMLTNHKLSLDLQFRGVPGRVPKEPPTEPEHTWDGRELWLRKPNWAAPPEVRNLRPSNFLDFEIGVVQRHTDVPFEKQQLRLQYTGRDFEDIEAIREFFFRCAGQQHEFYMPSFATDIDLDMESWDAGDNTLRVDGIDFANGFADDTTRRAISIHYTDGSVHRYVVERIYADLIEESDGNTPKSFIEIRGTLGRDTLIEEIDFVSWIQLFRLATDNATFEYHTDGVASVALTVQTAEREEAEDFA